MNTVVTSVSIEEMLEILNQTKGTIIISLTSRNRKLPGESGHTKFKKGDRSIPSPFTDGIDHLLKQSVMLGASYERMVNNQREREGIEEYFFAEQLWGGKGQRDKTYPRFVAQHKDKLTRYLGFRPYSSDPSGQPTPQIDEYYNARTQRKIKRDLLLQFYTPSVWTSKSQGTEKVIPWQTIKLDNVLEVKHNGQEYTIGT